MKKKVFFCATTILSVSLHAQVMTTLTPSGKDNDIKIDQCHFRMQDPFGGRIRVYSDEKPQHGFYKGRLMRNPERSEVTIKISCPNISQAFLRDCGLELKDGKLNTSGTEQFTEKEKKEIHEEKIDLSGKNWSGSGVQSDYVIQSQDIRVKEFIFCLKHDDSILSGHVSAVAEVDKSKESSLPNIIKLLESIEFIDDAPAQQ